MSFNKQSRVLVAAAVLLAVVLLWLTALLSASLFSGGSAAPAARAVVPAFDYRPWYGLAVQEGRTLPFETACRDAVRHITGRAKFEGFDPVAIVLAWMLTEGRGAGAGYTDWESYPFILCDHQELRRHIFADRPVETPGTRVTPADLRQSAGFDQLLEAVATKRKEQGARAHLELTTAHLKAEQVGRRLMLYDALCGRWFSRLHTNAMTDNQYWDLRAAAELPESAPAQVLDRLAARMFRFADPMHLVGLDRVPGSGWFSLTEVRVFARNPQRWRDALKVRVAETPFQYVSPEHVRALNAFQQKLQAGAGQAVIDELREVLAKRQEAILADFQKAHETGDRAAADRLFLQMISRAKNPRRLDARRPATADKGRTTLPAAFVEELRSALQEADEQALQGLQQGLSRARTKPYDPEAPESRMLHVDYLETRFPDLYRDALSWQAFPEAQADRVLTAFDAVAAAYKSGQPEPFAEASHAFVDTVRSVTDESVIDAPAGTSHALPYPGVTTLSLELLFNRVQPFLWAWVFMLAATFLLAIHLAWRARAVYVLGLSFYVTSLAVQAWGFYLRIRLSGRAPVSNMYETVIFVAFMAALFALVLELLYRRTVIALAGAAVATLGLILADQLPLALDPKISPIVPVLRSNYWLTVHVITIVSSYAAGTLAWGLGNLTLVLVALGRGQRETLKALGAAQK